MAIQRLSVATFVGESALVVDALVRSWRVGADPAATDRFCAAVRENGLALPVVYFCEWVDRWLMGDEVPGPEAVAGRRYEVACLSPEQAFAWADQCRHQFPEQQWFASHLREAAAVWDGAERRSIVVVREVVGLSTLDEEVNASLSVVPGWLLDLRTGRQ
jgi:hypothetical protein